MTQIGVQSIAPAGVPVYNPAFDVTPHRYLTGIVTEEGVCYPPFGESLRRAREAAEVRVRNEQARRARGSLGMKELGSVCVFCGASMGSQPAYVEAAVEVGRELGRRRLGLVYGGGSVGLMGALARAAQEAGSSVVGVIPESLTGREIMGDRIGELIVVETMHERKALMASLADAFMALPGGFGTMDELFEMVTWGQIGIHSKPVGLLNVAGYFDPLMQWVENGIDAGFIRAQHRDLLVTESEATALLEQLEIHRPPPGLVQWLGVGDA